ncbi:TetR/AcrR family transcriptional regulator [Clostridium sp. DJ247]|uniref:TetR/AcrR family transcriptional regulator n=1 Tax=Clostridium sp. DJ247 TaxID=2726188 RepID=UPI0016276A9D|nr:TetR/AcrR family transcriptional regulator [Clostridium sp. DJ247]MBC2582380.1 TetR/AcrR family transcriptional regulator [Clostridium sp. DJ247]
MNKTKRLIFESSIKIFSMYGYNGATMDTIAADAGVAKGTLYYHFKSKEEIFNYIIKEGMLLLKDRIESSIIEHEDILSKIKLLCKIQLGLVHESKDFFKVIMSQLWGQESRQLELRESIEKYINYIKTYLEEAIAQGVIKNGDSLHMAYTLFGTLCSVATYELIDEHGEDLEQLIDNILSYVLNGMQAT